MAQTIGMLTAAGSQQTSSMYRDIARGARIEAGHIVGDLIARGTAAGLRSPRLETIYTHLKAYEAALG